jgi:hypothetical protein
MIFEIRHLANSQLKLTTTACVPLQHLIFRNNGEQMTACADQATIMIVVRSIGWQGARHRTPETGKES